MEASLELSAAQIAADDFFESGYQLALPPQRSAPQGIVQAIDELGSTLGPAVVFATSGSTGEEKWVVIEKSALRSSAEMVCRHLGTSKGDRWICPLPIGHVGGAGVFVRARVSGGELVPWDGRWSPEQFTRSCEAEGVHWTSLVPTQVHDLVASGCRASRSLRGVVVGGGALALDQKRAAESLGWPILRSFGMTEASSQIATERRGEDELTVLEGWEVREETENRLAIRGVGLFSGYLLKRDSGDWSFERPFDEEGWFVSTDRVSLSNGGDRFQLEPLGRLDDRVKVLGELVSVDRIEDRLRQILSAKGVDSREFAVVAIPDPRAGNRLVLAASASAEEAENWRNLFNLSGVLPVERLSMSVALTEIPRSELGKVRRNLLAEIVLGV